MKKKLNVVKDKISANVVKDKIRLNVVKGETNPSVVKVEKYLNVVKLKLKNKLVIAKTKKHVAKGRLFQLVVLKLAVAKKELPHVALLTKHQTVVNVANEN